MAVARSHRAHVLGVPSASCFPTLKHTSPLPSPRVGADAVYWLSQSSRGPTYGGKMKTGARSAVYWAIPMHTDGIDVMSGSRTRSGSYSGCWAIRRWARPGGCRRSRSEISSATTRWRPSASWCAGAWSGHRRRGPPAAEARWGCGRRMAVVRPTL